MSRAVIVWFACLACLVCLIVPHATLADKRPRRRKRQNHKSAGIAHSKRGDLDAAIVAFRRAIVVNPEDSGGYNNLGVALMRQGVEMENIASLRQAKEAFRASLDILPSPATQENLNMVDQYLRDRGVKSSTSSQDNASAEIDVGGSISNDDRRKNEQTLLRQHCIRLQRASD